MSGKCLLTPALTPRDPVTSSGLCMFFKSVDVRSGVLSLVQISVSFRRKIRSIVAAFSNKNPTDTWACGMFSVEILFSVLS